MRYAPADALDHVLWKKSRHLGGHMKRLLIVLAAAISIGIRLEGPMSKIRFVAVAIMLAPVLSILGSPARATAAVIFDNGAPDLQNAIGSDRDVLSAQLADDFVLTTGQTTIRDVHWSGVYALSNTPPATDSFTIYIHADASGIPGSLLHTISGAGVSREATSDVVGEPIFGEFDLFTYSVATSPITLSAGTTYWLSVLNDTSADADDNWFWAQASLAGNHAIRVPTDDSPWFGTVRFDLSFSLTDDITTGAVPEPSTLLLLGGGVLVVGWRRLRKRSAR